MIEWTTQQDLISGCSQITAQNISCRYRFGIWTSSTLGAERQSTCPRTVSYPSPTSIRALFWLAMGWVAGVIGNCTERQMPAPPSGIRSARSRDAGDAVFHPEPFDRSALADEQRVV